MTPAFPHAAPAVMEAAPAAGKDLFVNHDKKILANGIADSASAGYKWCEGCQRHVSVARGFTPDTGECRVCLHSLSPEIYEKWMARLHQRHDEKMEARPAILG